MKKKDIVFTTKQNKNNTTNIAGVAHDLRGVVAKLQGLHSLLKPSIRHNTEAQQIFYLLETVCKHGMDITSNIIENNTLTPLKNKRITFKKYSLNNLIKKQAKVYQMQANLKEIDLTTEIPNHNILCKINRHYFVRLLDNLMENAIKFTSRKGQINIMLSKINEKAILEIRDSGVGIPKELLASIFNKNTIHKRVGTEGEKSTGIGLSIVKDIIDFHAGNIYVKSSEKTGTSFIVELNYISK